MSSIAGYVYAIENTINGHRYIGSTTNYKNRWHSHRSSLRKGVHHSFILQKAWNKYGEAAFVFKLLVICHRNQRIEYENRLMPLQSYNILRTAKESMVRGGWSHTVEFRQKLSAIHKGKRLTADHRKKIAESAANRKYDDEFRRKARQRQLGVKVAKSTKEKLSLAVKEYRKAESELKMQRTRMAHQLVICGESVKKACSQYKISKTTFYKNAKLLSLSLHGHKNRGLVK